MGEDQTQPIIFLDASVLVAAALSPRGGSFRVVSEAPLRGYRSITSAYAYRETERAIRERYPQCLIELSHLVAFFEITPDPPARVVEPLLAVIDFKDAPVLASALHYQAQTLLTLDRAHFLENKELPSRFTGLKIMTPGDFIRCYF